MRLLAKFNLILLSLFVPGLVLAAHFAHEFLIGSARAQVLQQAQLMVESARSTRDYTADQLSELLRTTPAAATRFVPQTIPFYAATETFNRLRKEYPDYTYKEASLNPTNPRDRAVDWEADVISHFRNQPGRKELVGERDTPTGRMLFLAHPIATEASCLDCHSTPERAPATILSAYGRTNGFGWQPGEIVAAQIVSVPMAVLLQKANHAFRDLLVYLIAIFALTMGVIDASLYAIIIRPVRSLAGAADRISTGELDRVELPVDGKDEIAALTASFNRMRVSLQKAFEMLRR